MNCPKCETKTKVVDSRSDRDRVHGVNMIGTVRRIHQCPGCTFRFETAELTLDDLDNWGSECA